MGRRGGGGGAGEIVLLVDGLRYVVGLVFVNTTREISLNSPTSGQMAVLWIRVCGWLGMLGENMRWVYDLFVRIFFIMMYFCIGDVIFVYIRTFLLPFFI